MPDGEEFLQEDGEEAILAGERPAPERTHEFVLGEAPPEERTDELLLTVDPERPDEPGSDAVPGAPDYADEHSWNAMPEMPPRAEGLVLNIEPIPPEETEVVVQSVAPIPPQDMIAPVPPALPSTLNQAGGVMLDLDIEPIPPAQTRSFLRRDELAERPRERPTPAVAEAPVEEQEGEAAPTAIIELGYVNFDVGTPDNASCEILVPAERAEHFRRDMYVGIRDAVQHLEFLGRVVAGPFHPSQEQLERQNAAAVDPGLKQPYHVLGRIEILGQLVEGDRSVPTPTRPRPYSEVYIFPDHRLQQFLGIDGDFFLGHLAGHKTVRVRAQGDNRNFLPRNVGIFGTVGSGKSNTAQVLTEEALEAGWAVVLIDVEGEYVCMNEATDDPDFVASLYRDYRLHPKGVGDFRVYVPSSGRSTASSIPFKVPISGLYPEVVADILSFTEAEMRVFAMVTAQAGRMSIGEPGPDGKEPRPYDLQQLVDGLIETPSMNGPANVRLLPMANEQDISTAGVLRSKLTHLGRSGMLDWRETTGIPELPLQELLVGGRLSVLDISETDTRSRNIAIAYVLQELFKKVIETPRGEMLPSGRPRPPVLVVIEEVHTFVSRAAAPKMRAVLDSLQIISRRGRKRWMALSLVSQQPNHVPDEIFELANTRFIHQVKSPSNLDPIKRTTAGVDAALWTNVPAMGPGQSLLTGAAFKKPLFIKVRPACSRRLHAK